MKKIIVIFLSLIMCAFFAGCGTYTPATGNNPGNTPGGDTPGGSDNSAPFTVKLMCEKVQIYPGEDVGAQWYNGENLYTAPFVNGVASVTGLDGDYRVTLTNVPEGYTYDPNTPDNTATNNKREVEIELLPIISVLGTGTGFFTQAYAMNRTGVYAVKFDKAGQSVYCKFTPAERGTYVLESLMDITANEINPRLEDYGQNTNWVPPYAYDTCKDGGFAAAYTRNFKYSVSIDGDCFHFIIKCDSRVGYPATVFFKIAYGEDYSRDPVYEMKEPERVEKTVGEDKVVIPSPVPEGSYVRCGNEQGNVNKFLDGSKFALGEDGYYHMKDADGNPTGSIVYANLDEFTKIIQDINPDTGAITYIPVSLKVGKYDYLYFIKGWDGLIERYDKEELIPEKFAKLKGGHGYMSTILAGGGKRAAVTEELREFLQAYAQNRHLFFDGMGEAEHAGYNSDDDSQWLYYCGYYI